MDFVLFLCYFNVLIVSTQENVVTLSEQDIFSDLPEWFLYYNANQEVLCRPVTVYHPFKVSNGADGRWWELCEQNMKLKSKCLKEIIYFKVKVLVWWIYNLNLDAQYKFVLAKLQKAVFWLN